jgi:hypothetical protein
MNAKHQFKYTYNEGCEDFSPVEVTFDMPGDVTIRQMLWNFECYLKACGFYFDGHLEVVPEGGYDLEDEVEEEPPYCCMGDSDCCEESEEYKAEKLKEWSEGIAKLDNEQKKKANEDARKMSDLHYEATKEVVKNKWVHGICNPPSPDWKASNSDNCWNSAKTIERERDWAMAEIAKLQMKLEGINEASNSDNCWNS